MGEIEDLSRVPTIGINRPSGRPVAVENLAFTHDDIGNGHLSYDYEGESYYITSAPTGTANCFDFEWKTITNGGVVESGEYCNVIRTDGGMGMGGGAMGMAGGGMGAAMKPAHRKLQLALLGAGLVIDDRRQLRTTGRTARSSPIPAEEPRGAQ